jgi:hypothetical protein
MTCSIDSPVVNRRSARNVDNRREPLPRWDTLHRERIIWHETADDYGVDIEIEMVTVNRELRGDSFKGNDSIGPPATTASRLVTAEQLSNFLLESRVHISPLLVVFGIKPQRVEVDADFIQNIH